METKCRRSEALSVKTCSSAQALKNGEERENDGISGCLQHLTSVSFSGGGGSDWANDDDHHAQGHASGVLSAGSVKPAPCTAPHSAYGTAFGAACLAQGHFHKTPTSC